MNDQITLAPEVRAEVFRRLSAPQAVDRLLAQPTEWDPDRWRRMLPEFEQHVAALESLSVVGRTWLMILRGDVLSLATQGDEVLLFLAAMVWGYGRRGRQFRVAEALGVRTPPGWSEPIDLVTTRQRLRKIRRLAGEDPTESFARAVHAGSDLHLPGIGHAFATKFLYVAGFDHALRAGGTPPLILDANVATALGFAIGSVSATKYAQYLDLCRELAPERPDLVELALFEIGSGSAG